MSFLFFCWVEYVVLKIHIYNLLPTVTHLRTVVRFLYLHIPPALRSVVQATTMPI